MEKVEVKFNEWLQKGFDLYKENIGLLILSALLMIALSVVTFGILAGPMMAGMITITLRLMDRSQPVPTPGDIFKGFDYFLNAFLYILVWGAIGFAGSLILGAIPFIGSIASLFYTYALQALIVFALYLIVDRKMEFWPASMESLNIIKTNFWPFFGFTLVTSIIGSIGVVACFVGAIVTIPIQICMVTAAYRDIFPVEGEPQETAVDEVVVSDEDANTTM